MWVGCACAGDTIKTHKYGLLKVAEDVVKHVFLKLYQPCSFRGVRSQTELIIAVEYRALNIGEVHALGVASRESPKKGVCRFIPPNTLGLRPVCECRQCRRQDMHVGFIVLRLPIGLLNTRVVYTRVRTSLPNPFSIIGKGIANGTNTNANARGPKHGETWTTYIS